MTPGSSSDDLVAAALAAPSATGSWPAARCGLLVRQARAAGLLGRLVAGDDDARAPHWPPAAGGHIESARRVTRAQHAEIQREARHIERALATLGAPVVLLKGAAYVMAGLPAAAGRVFSDVDILVPKALIGQAESLLMLAGWMSTKQSAYDQRYYREWMHELPPMEHVHRKTTIDVHHAILPETARLRPDSQRLLDAAVPVPGHPGLRVLSPVDMVLHSATHLFMNDEMGHALRDLSDIDLLLRHFGSCEPGFWDRLVPRAVELELGRPLHYALRHARRLLKTPIPTDVLESSRPQGPGAALNLVMDWIWHRALRSPHPSTDLTGRSLALFALYVRGHWLRMPPLLLLRHLSIKAFRLNERGREKPPPGPPR
jgi:Uncharacterised nucleotidyltransferase